jgi:RNA polymerase sigma factor (sigma-70 family)
VFSIEQHGGRREVQLRTTTDPNDRIVRVSRDRARGGGSNADLSSAMSSASGSGAISADRVELERFCASEYPRLVGFLSLYCGDRFVGEELAQETLERVVRNWRRVRDLDSPSGWAHRVAVNLANSSWRRRQAARRADRFLHRRDDLHDAGPDVTTRVAVHDAVRSLPDRQRAAVLLRYFGDQSVAEVARALGCPTGTVKTLTRQGVQALRARGLAFTDDEEQD